MDKSNKKREYCEILGVSAEADEEQVKRAYRKLVLEHPDRPNNKGKEQEAAVMFNKINEAYEGLNNGNATLNMLKGCFKSTEIYTSLEHFLYTSGKTFTSLNTNGNNSKEFNVNNPTSPVAAQPTFFASTTKLRTPRNGQSLQTTLKISFHESLTGCTKTIEYAKNKNCTTCEGQGIVSRKDTCKDCEGKKSLVREGSSGQLLIIPCTTCCKLPPTERCPTCIGTGKVPTRTTFTVQVPKGVYTSMKKTYEGEGDEGDDGGASGDLIVFFEVEQHSFYLRPNIAGEDVFCRILVPFPHAALGTVLEIPSMYGKKISVTLPAATPHDHVIRVPDEGFYGISKGRRGDMYIQVGIEVPKVLDEEEKQLLRKLASSAHFKPMFQCSSEK